MSEAGRALALILALALWPSCVGAAATADAGVTDLPPCARADNLDALPPWSYDAMLAPVREALRSRGLSLVESRLLAWYEMEDERPLRVRGALLWARSEGRAGRRWALADLYSHPRESTRWLESFVTDVDWEPIRLLECAPDSAATALFVHAPGAGHFDRAPGFRYLEARVRERTWAAVVGSRALSLFSGPSECARGAPR